MLVRLDNVVLTLCVLTEEQAHQVVVGHFFCFVYVRSCHSSWFCLRQKVEQWIKNEQHLWTGDCMRSASDVDTKKRRRSLKMYERSLVRALA